MHITQFKVRHCLLKVSTPAVTYAIYIRVFDNNERHDTNDPLIPIHWIYASKSFVAIRIGYTNGAALWVTFRIAPDVARICALSKRCAQSNILVAKTSELADIRRDRLSHIFWYSRIHSRVGGLYCSHVDGDVVIFLMVSPPHSWLRMGDYIEAVSIKVTLWIIFSPSPLTQRN